MGVILSGVGVISFIGYLIWLIVRIRNWDSKIPPIIGMLLSVVMLLGGISSAPMPVRNSTPKTEDSPSTSAPQESEVLTEIEIKEMYSNPSKYKNKSLELVGKVFSDPEYDSGAVYFQMWGDPENSDMNTFVKYDGNDVDIESGIYVKVSGIVNGTSSGVNAFGAKVTAPKITADSVEIISYQDAVHPALHTIVPSEPTQTQRGYSVTVEKIELAERQTRVYIKVENGGSDKFNLYSFNSTIIQNGKQYDEERDYNSDYPDVQTGLNVGVTTEGIFCYPAIENSDFQLILNGSSENYREKLNPFTFDITVDQGTL